MCVCVVARAQCVDPLLLSGAIVSMLGDIHVCVRHAALDIIRQLHATTPVGDGVDDGPGLVFFSHLCGQVCIDRRDGSRRE